MKGWKEKFLTQARRETILEAVLQTILSYVMGCFHLLVFVCNQIEALNAMFFWRGNIEDEKV